MNNEPVAWIAYDEFGDFMLEATPEGDYPWKPLYTHPAKTLTAQEVMEQTHKNISEAHWKAKTLTDEEIEIIAEALLMIGFKDDFINYDLKEKAQAILRKAQEK